MTSIDRINQSAVGREEIYQLLSSAVAGYHDLIARHPEEYLRIEDERKYGKDLSNLFELDSNQFIRKLYQVLLSRDADWAGFYHNLKALCDGMPREALIYSIAQSPEFNMKFRIRNLGTYQQIYLRHQADLAAGRPFYGGALNLANPIDQPIVDQITARNQEVDLTGLLGLDINLFIEHIYHCMLNRPVDAAAFNHYQRLLCQGMPRESVIFMIAGSTEFNKRFSVKNLALYEKRHRTYRIKARLKSLPVLGLGYALIKFTRNITNLDTDIRIFEANRRQEEQSGIKSNQAAARDTNAFPGTGEGQINLANCLLKEIYDLLSSDERDPDGPDATPLRKQTCSRNC